jgi:hypothetical protein
MAAGEPSMREKKLVKTLIAIEVLEMTENGLKLITLLKADPPSSDTEAITATLREFTMMAHDNERMFLITDEVGFSISGLTTKTIVFKGVFENREPMNEKKN